MTTSPGTLRAAREETIDALCRGFARDVLTLGELERRLERARLAGTREELRALLLDLGAPSGPLPVPADATSTPVREPERTPPAAGRTRAPIRTGSHLAVAVMGGTRRAGRWAPPGSMVAVAIMGGVELDFRDAVLEPGVVVDINVFAFWGGVEITVPPDVHVDSRGFALLGGFDQTAELDSNPSPGAPVIRVNGLAIMGGVEVRVKEKESGGTKSMEERW